MLVQSSCYIAKYIIHFGFTPSSTFLFCLSHQADSCVCVCLNLSNQKESPSTVVLYNCKSAVHCRLEKERKDAKVGDSLSRARASLSRLLVLVIHQKDSEGSEERNTHYSILIIYSTLLLCHRPNRRRRHTERTNHKSNHNTECKKHIMSSGSSSAAVLLRKGVLLLGSSSVGVCSSSSSIVNPSYHQVSRHFIKSSLTNLLDYDKKIEVTGLELLRNADINRGLAWTEEERKRYKLRGKAFCIKEKRILAKSNPNNSYHINSLTQPELNILLFSI